MKYIYQPLPKLPSLLGKGRGWGFQINNDTQNRNNIEWRYRPNGNQPAFNAVDSCNNQTGRSAGQPF